MLDCHCHLDRYPEPDNAARRATQRGVFVVAVTNLPSHFRAGLPHIRPMNRVRLAIGLHPLAAEEHQTELALFEELLPQTSFVGEVGLDFSRAGKSTAEAQLRSFRFVVERVARGAKVMSIHSRGAEGVVLDILNEYGVGPAVFHWYSGPRSVLARAVDAGHYFSVNPAMTASKNGQEVIRSIPRGRILTESDAPYAKLRGVTVNPWDVAVVEHYLAGQWSEAPAAVRAAIWSNFQRLVEPFRSCRRGE
jgi:TatD DNase family protein